MEQGEGRGLPRKRVWAVGSEEAFAKRGLSEREKQLIMENVERHLLKVILKSRPRVTMVIHCVP